MRDLTQGPIPGHLLTMALISQAALSIFLLTRVMRQRL